MWPYIKKEKEEGYSLAICKEDRSMFLVNQKP